ncbi:MAG: outer membrane beta-barrel protein [Bdellovibrionales bacterium]|nr:outer membrane beta-barrel protein [Bdellovibrionales bacterium]
MNRYGRKMRSLRKPLGQGLGFLALVLGMTSGAQAELLVEGANKGSMTSVDSPAEPSEVMEAIPASAVAPAPVAAQPAPAVVASAPVPVQIVQAPPAPVAVPAQPYPVIITTAAPAAPVSAAQAPEQQALNRTELMRRERLREELRNEDLLQERLEDLRLQDEKRRTGQLAGQPSAPVPAPVMAPMAGVVAPTLGVAPVSPVIEEQVVSVPVSDRGASAGSSTLKVSDLQTSSEIGNDDVFTIRLAPRGGVSNFSGPSPYAVEGRYTVGVALDMGVSDHLNFELGYSYSDYGLALNDATANALRGVLNPYGLAYGGSNDKTAALRQNVVDAGLKLHLLGMSSRLRPYIGGGAGYSRSYLNYDPRILDFLKQYGYGTPPDYEMSQFLAYASAGLDIRLSKSVSVGASYRHYTVLSSRQNQDLYNPALYGAYSGYYGYGGGVGTLGSIEQQYAGGSLSETSFHSLTGTVSFQF